MVDDLPTAAALRQRFRHYDGADSGASSVIPIRQADTFGGEPARLMQYLRGFGLIIETADDVYAGVVSLRYEEELTAFRCREGVAVAHASDGWWLVFGDGAAIPPLGEGREQTPTSAPAFGEQE